MNYQSQYCIFGRCQNMLGRRFSHDLKTFKFLGCAVSADFDDSPKPYQALRKNWQPRDIYESFKNLIMAHIISVSWSSPHKIVRSLKKVLVNYPLLFRVAYTNTGFRNDLFDPLERSDDIIRPTAKKKEQSPTIPLGVGVVGDLFLHFSQKFHLSPAIT